MLNNLVNWFLYSPVFNGQAYLEYYSPKKKGPPYPEMTLTYALFDWEPKAA
jgi:hypothetical protein